MSMTERLIKMLESGRDDPMLRFGLGSAFFNEDRFEEAVEHLEACIRQDEDYSAAYKLLGKSAYQLGDLDRAQSVFERGLAIAQKQGDKQTEKEIRVFQKKIGRQKEQSDGDNH